MASDIVLNLATRVIRGAVELAQCGSPAPLDVRRLAPTGRPRSPSGKPTSAPAPSETHDWLGGRRPSLARRRSLALLSAANSRAYPPRAAGSPRASSRNLGAQVATERARDGDRVRPIGQCNNAALVLVTRRVVMIERATRASAKVPCSTGLRRKSTRWTNRVAQPPGSLHLTSRTRAPTMRIS